MFLNFYTQITKNAWKSNKSNQIKPVVNILKIFCTPDLVCLAFELIKGKC